MSIAESTATRAKQSHLIIGKDWSQDFGSCSCEEFRSIFEALLALATKPNGKIRLVCHCVPLRCHAQAIAERLCTLLCSSPFAISQPDSADTSSAQQTENKK